MKILKQEDIRPIRLAAGDSIVLTYDDGIKKKEVLRETVTESMTFDRAAVVEWPNGIKALGMKKAIGGIFGTRD